MVINFKWRIRRNRRKCSFQMVYLRFISKLWPISLNFYDKKSTYLYSYSEIRLYFFLFLILIHFKTNRSQYNTLRPFIDPDIVLSVFMLSFGFYDCMWSFWVEADFLYLCFCIVFGNPVIKNGMNAIPLTRLIPPHISAWVSTCVVLFSSTIFRWEVIVWVLLYWCSCWLVILYHKQLDSYVFDKIVFVWKKSAILLIVCLWFCLYIFFFFFFLL